MTAATARANTASYHDTRGFTGSDAVTLRASHRVLDAPPHGADEHLTVDDTHRAMLNILEDVEDEKNRLEAARSALLNILDDVALEKALFADVQRAALNILDDFDRERQKVGEMNAELRNEIGHRTRAVEALRRANAATEAANKELESFSYSVAHDLRAPLRSIDGFSQALVEDCADSLPTEGKAYLRHVRESAQHMAQLIDDLLALSRLGRAEIVRARIDLAEIARTVVTRLQRESPYRAVDVVIAAEIIAEGDARLLEVVFDNLLGNAWKFTAKRATARIEVGSVDQNGHVVCFVRDNGAGFDMAYADKLFAVFQRLHSVSEFEGTGIGLANVERIIRRHGGRIWGEGEVDRGAVFYFTLEEGV
jgi:light-regulated signal transduction histidine kinase (bacteriophytochrome)